VTRIRMAWKNRQIIVGALRRRNWTQARIWLGFVSRESDDADWQKWTDSLHPEEAKFVRDSLEYEREHGDAPQTYI
jgi:hypothetical protein